MSNRLTALYSKVEKYREHKEAPEVQRELEYIRRRKLRKQRSKIIRSDRKLYLYKRIHALAAVILLLGIIVTFGSTVRSLGEGSFLWNKRHVFNIMGPVLLGLGVLATLVGSALVFKRKDRVIEEKGLSRQNSSFSSFRRHSQDNSTSKRSLSREMSVDSNSTDYRFHRQQKLVGFPGRSADDSDVEAFLQSSTSSSSTSYTTDGKPLLVNCTSPFKKLIDERRPPLLRQQAVQYSEKEIPEEESSREYLPSMSFVETSDEMDGFRKCNKEYSANDSSFGDKETHGGVWIFGVHSQVGQNGVVNNIRKESYQQAVELPVTMSVNSNTKLVEMSV